MRDLTKDSITSHILAMAAPVAIGMFTQMAYQLVDLYFVAKLGKAAIAGVSTAGNAMLIVMALTQVLGVGTVALIAHAAGRKDQADGNLVFNQSLTLSAVFGVLTMAVLIAFVHPYLKSIAADAATAEAGTTFIFWLMPCFVLMFPMTAIGSALRATGVVQPTMVIQILTVLINAILAPILIAGWGTGVALGVKGGGLASSISVAIGTMLLAVYFHRLEHFVAIKRTLMPPQLKQWRRMLKIGLPAGGEFALQFVFTAVVYYTIRHFGASAQAGFGIGSRVLQAILLPAMAVAFSAGPIVGQNFGAKNGERVKETFRKAALIGTAAMIVITIIAQWRPQALVSVFDADAAALAIAALFLQLVSWNFVALGLVFTCSTTFQGLGNTVPSLISTATRLFVFAVPAIWLSMLPEFRFEQVCYLYIASATLQACLSLWLLRVEFSKRLALVVA
jgi:putative MATE family efflux protein